MSAAVTDTNPLLFHAARRRLGKKAAAHFRACELQKAVVYVPMGVIWEVSLLTRRGRIDLGGSPRQFFETLFSNPGFQALDLGVELVLVADEIVIGHDPFDNLICAAALSLELPLMTADGPVRESGIVKVLWD